MFRQIKVWMVTLAVAAAALSGCSNSKEAPPEAPVSPVQSSMMRSLEALDQLSAKLKANDLAGSRVAYNAFSTAFGEVLGPISMERPDLAQKMANANSAIKEAMAGTKPDAALISREAGTISSVMQQSAEAFGLKLAARASSEVGHGAGGHGGMQQPAKAMTVEVHAKEYSFTPNRIELEKGTRLTVRLVNDGTKKHEWEAEGLKQEIPPTDPGASREITFVVDKPGSYEFICDIDDHEDRGMRGLLVVK